jgi:chorismate mutase
MPKDRELRPHTDLQALRDEIDEIDLQIAGLLARRFSLVVAIGELKQKGGVPVQDRAREEIVLSRVSSVGKSPEAASFIAQVYEKILSKSRSVQADECS